MNVFCFNIISEHLEDDLLFLLQAGLKLVCKTTKQNNKLKIFFSFPWLNREMHCTNSFFFFFFKSLVKLLMLDQIPSGSSVSPNLRARTAALCFYFSSVGDQI